MRVAAHRGLGLQWLNDSAAGFQPATFREEDCAVVVDHPQLLVLGAPFDQVFLMKLYRAGAQDYEDLISLWPLSGFASPETAARMFYDAYPHAPEDTFLTGMIREIAVKAAERP